MSTSASPVHKLPHDILLSIFLANANEADLIPPDPEEEEWRDPEAPQHPLTTTRRSSQVCRAWRELILGSATLWGRLLDVNALCGQRGKRQWGEEVLQRAGGTAPLWVSRTAQIEPDEPAYTPPALREFLFRILDAHWERVEILYLRLRVADFLAWIGASPTLTLPAPALRRFTFLPPYFIDVGDRLFLPSIFANSAPRLRKYYAPALPFTTASSRFTSLRVLTTAFLPEFSLLTAALAHMPLLEELSVFGCPSTTSLDALTLDQLLLPPHTPHIPLPRLRRLVVQGDLNTCLLLTQGIRPGAGCALEFESACRAGNFISEDVLAALGGLFREYFAGYLGRYSAPDAEWAFYVEVSKPVVRVRLKSGRSDWPCVFLVSWFNSSSMQSGDVVRGLFLPSPPPLPSPLTPSSAPADSLALLAGFASIEHMRFWSRVTLDSAKRVVRDVLASFTSLKTLEARGDGLSFVFLPLPLVPDPLQLLPTAGVNTASTSPANETQIEPDQHPIPSAASSPSLSNSKFPALHTLTWSDRICTSDLASTVLPILHARVAAGCKLRMLEFSRPLGDSMGNCKFEALVGACVGPLVGRVRWREGEDVVDLWAEE